MPKIVVMGCATPTVWYWAVRPVDRCVCRALSCDLCHVDDDEATGVHPLAERAPAPRTVRQESYLLDLQDRVFSTELWCY
jgi:hypothetical protein